MNRRPFRHLVAGGSVAADRVLFTSVWFKGHNNPRYAELLPRLARVDGYLAVCSNRRIPRGLEFWSYRWGRPVHYPPLLRLASKRYRGLFTADNEQIPWFRGPIVSDVDDPRFSEREVRQLNHPNLAAYVVTAERAARRLESMGVEKPYHVIPQGISLSSLTPELIAAAAARRREGEIVVGYMAAFLLTAADRDGANTLYNVDHLLDLWDEISRKAPHTRLWLIGDASDRVRARCQGRDDILVLGLLPREQALAHTASFDIALYPRTKDQGIRAAKVGEYIGLGIPTVSYDYEVTDDLRSTGAGLLVPTPSDFVEAVASLATDDARRLGITRQAEAAGAALDWDVLARRYETEIIDRYLPPR